MNVVIIGAGGHGRVVLDVLRSAGKFHVVGFIDADAGKSGGEVMGVPILGPIHLLQKLRKQDPQIKGAIVAIGDNRVRRTYADQVLESGLELINAIHPSAVVSQTAKIGRNVLVAAGAIVGAGAVVIEDVAAGATVAGVPARVIRAEGGRQEA